MDSIFMEYDIIKYIESKNSNFYVKIKELYNICEVLLSEIPKVFSNYTLHDIGHSVRVIGYMNDLVKNHLCEFSDLHLALIVYVGLLHDTGMVISDDEKNELYTGFERKDFEFKKYSEEDKILYLQDYIRKNHGKRVFSVLDYEINDDTKIKSLLYEGQTNSYDLSSLIADICRSHTEDCNWIINNLDSTRYYGDYKINPQHIALLLRIGDALDIDDRRAPYVLYKLLNPKGYSNNEWRKHVPITNYKKISDKHQTYEIIFSGECSEPIIYRKIMEYIEMINDDIKKVLFICESFDELYKLNITVPIKTLIKTIGFVGTPLRFNLQYKQISKLLMGEKIYGSRKDGLRELLQNAIDTVMLMKSLNEKNFYSTYVPKIGIEIDKVENKFIVFDNGTGMSDNILEKYFFNIGNSYYVSDEFCNEKYTYEPIGHFGIGFLACFMLASKIDIETKHHQTAQVIRMSFDKESPYVTKLDSSRGNFFLDHGTKIIMDYDAVIPDIFNCEEDIVNFIKELLIIDEYEFWVINNCKKRLYVKGPQKKCLVGNDNIEFEYTLKSYINVRFNIFDFFENNKDIYIVDNMWGFLECNYISLAYFKETIIELEREMQISGQDIYEVLYDMNVPEFIFELIRENKLDLLDYYNKNKNILGFFNHYLCEYINDGSLTWYEIPLILHKDIFNSFLDAIESEGLERALKQYANNIQYISILCKGNILTDELVLEVLKDFIDLFEAEYDTIDVSYYSTYPVPLIKKSIDLLGFSESSSYLRVVHNYQNFASKLYLRGIRVRDENIIIPHTIAGIELENVFLNIKSGDYETDVSRNNFDLKSKERLINQMIHMIYEDIMKQKKLDKDEIKLIQLFLRTYYTRY